MNHDAAKSEMTALRNLGGKIGVAGLATPDFDLVYANMSLMDIPDAEAALAEVGRLARPGGRLVASISHPCFDTDVHSAWLSERVHSAVWTGRLVWRYRNPTRTESPWSLPDGTVRFTGSYHRPLSWYVRAISAAGFAIDRLVEPTPGPEFWEKDREAAWIAEIPLHLVLGAHREGAPPGRTIPPRKGRSGRRPRTARGH